MATSTAPSSADSLTEREVIIISVSATLVGTSTVGIVALLVWLWCKKRKANIRSNRLHARLEQLSVRDPLEELVRQESARSVSNVSNVTGLDTWSKNLYKVWDESRLNRQFVFATSLEELRAKAKEKLRYACEVKVVLETDGTEVTSDDELRACHGAILMLLRHEEAWPPPEERERGFENKARVTDDGLSYTGSVKEMTEMTSSVFPDNKEYYDDDTVKL